VARECTIYNQLTDTGILSLNTLQPAILACQQLLTLCQVSSDEKVAVFYETGTRKDLIDMVHIALDNLCINYTDEIVTSAPAASGPVIRSTGSTTVLDDQPETVERLCEADFIIDLSIEGLMHSRATAKLLGSGARIQNISNEHPEILARMTPQPEDMEPVRQAVKLLRGAKQMQVLSESGTALDVSLKDAVSVGVWGWTNKPGTLAHWPGGLVVSFPAANSVNGTLVLAPGDVNLTFKRYLESSVTLMISNDYVVEIQGDGTDARLMRNYLQGFNEEDAYATSHVGWGMNTRARYESMTMYDKQDFNGTELRALAGNFLYSTGANEFAKRFTRGHFDLPVMDCDIIIDGQTVVQNGQLV